MEVALVSCRHDRDLCTVRRDNNVAMNAVTISLLYELMLTKNEEF